MSFILDALRKSESERQRDATPSLSRIPEAVAGRRLPLWAACTIASLGLGVVGLGAALWMTRDGERAPTEAVAGGRASSATGAAARDGAASAAPRDPARASGPPLAETEPRRPSSTVQARRGSVAPEAEGAAVDVETRSAFAGPEAQRESVDFPAQAAANLGTRRAADSPPRAASANLAPYRAAAGSEQAGGADEGAAANAPAFLPRYEAAAAADPSLPKLNLEFHAFSADPSRRFVYINGEKYEEGSNLGQGLRIARITADGVIVEAAGRQLMLARK